MHITKGDRAELLLELSEITARRITEIHTRDFYAGKGPWRGLNGRKEQRSYL